MSPDSGGHQNLFRGGEKQGAGTIVRALHFDARHYCSRPDNMGLSLKETRKPGSILCVALKKKAGKAAIFIDHKYLHVYSVADRVVVLDRGRVAVNL